MRRMLSLAIFICPLVILFQGCYTIVDLPDIAYDEYISTPEPIYPYEPPSGPIPHPPIPRPPHPHPPIIVPIIVAPPVTISNPPTYHRKDDIKKIRDNGSGRGNSGRNSDFNKSTKTRTDTNSSTNNSCSSNSDNTRGSSNSGSSGNIRK